MGRLAVDRIDKQRWYEMPAMAKILLQDSCPLILGIILLYILRLGLISIFLANHPSH